MSLGSDTAKNNSLAACYGDNKSTLWPTTVTLRLYLGDPANGGVELDSTGNYSAIAIASTSANLGTLVGGMLSNSVAFSFPQSTGAWQYVPDHWAFTDGSGNLLDTGFINDTSGVTQANQIATFGVGALQIQAA